MYSEEWSRTEVCSIAIILLVHNVTGRAYILGGNLCQDAQAEATAWEMSSSVEMLDTVIWASGRPFPDAFGQSSTDNFQFAMLDHELVAAYLRTKRTGAWLLFR